MIDDLDSSNLLPAISGVLAHEIGHLFGTPDHNSNDPLLDGQSDACLWGQDMINQSTNVNIYTNLIMCDYCHSTIQSNNDKFND